MPKLISQLYDSEFFIYIGGQPFRIPRDLFSGPGDHPNFFDLNISVNFSQTTEVFPGLTREGLLRPPSILPPSVPNHSAETFKELLHYLRGYPINIRNEAHRQELLNDCKYYHFKGLEQKLIHHHVSFNYFRNKEEIIIRLEDIKPSRIAFAPDQQSSSISENRGPRGWIVYGRPFVDDIQRELIVEIGSGSTKLDVRSMRVEFTGKTNERITNFFQFIANKLNLPTTQPLGLIMMSQNGRGPNAGALQPQSPGATPLSEDRVKVRIEKDCFVIVDGEELGDRERDLIFNGNFNNGSNNNLNSLNINNPSDSLDDDLFYQQQMQIAGFPTDHNSPIPIPGSATSARGGPGGNILGPNSPHTPNTNPNNMWPPHQPSPQQVPQQSPHLRGPGQVAPVAPVAPMPNTSRGNPPNSNQNPPPKRRRLDTSSDHELFAQPIPPQTSTSPKTLALLDRLSQGLSQQWVIKRGQWRARVQSTQNLDGKGGMEVILYAVRLEAWSGEGGRNQGRGFLVS